MDVNHRETRFRVVSTPRTERQGLVRRSDISTNSVSLYKPLPDRGKMHARHVEDKNRAPGQLSPAREANKNAEPNAPNSVGQKDRQELR